MKRITLSELKPKIVLGVAAHPDDLEFGASGTVAKWANAGAEIYYLILTDGGKGSTDRHISPGELTKTRRNEQRAACEVLGVKDVFFCDYEDGALKCNQDVKRDIARIIRQVRPDTVITWDPTVIYSADYGFINHPDHRAAGQAALGAIYPLARDHLSLPELLAEGLEPHKVQTVLLMNMDKQNYYEDTTQTLDTKIKALHAHKSQFSDWDKTEKFVRDLAAEMGSRAGCSCAEGFVRLELAV